MLNKDSRRSKSNGGILLDEEPTEANALAKSMDPVRFLRAEASSI